MSGMGLLLATLAGLAWAAALVVVRYSGVSPAAMPLIIAVGSFVAVLPTAYFAQMASLRWQAVAIAFVGALLNGVGMTIGWQGVVGGAVRGQWELSAVAPTMYISLITFTAVGSVIFLGDHFTWSKATGIVFAAAAIWLLSR